MAFTNTGFETSATPGYPTGWTITPTTAAESMALFGTASPRIDAESFEAEWLSGAYLFAFDPLVDIIAPLFNTSVALGDTFEAFEKGWSSNQGYSFAWSNEDPAIFDAAGTPESVEDFEELWQSNESYAFAMGATTPASFDTAGMAESVEDFEELWDGNESYAFAMGATSAASFDSGGTPEVVEDFEETAGPYITTADYANTRLALASHGLTNGEVVYVYGDDDGALPNGLSPDTKYYVVTALTNTFQLAVTSGGSPVSFTAFGSGIVNVKRNPAAWWPIATF